MNTKDKITILHLTYDYAEENLGKSTIVINDLIRNISEFSEPIIINIKKVFSLEYLRPLVQKKESNYKVVHFGFPFALFILSISKFIGKLLLKTLLDTKFHIVHTHKLTFEGFIGFIIAKKFSKPLFISIRQTDFYVLKFRPDLIFITKKQLKYASKIFIIAPFMKAALKKLYNEKFYSEFIEPKIVFLPNTIDLSKFNPKPNQISNKFLTICWLKRKVVKRKNLYRLLLAIKRIENIELEIIGHGDYEKKVRLWIKKLNLENRVKVLGFIPNEKIPDYLSSAKAFLMPSLSETFGVAYAEALACGVPIMYSKNTGFDGLFDNIGTCVNPRSIEDIKNGIIELIEKNDFFRKKIMGMIEVNRFEIFSRESIAITYKKCLTDIVIDGFL